MKPKLSIGQILLAWVNIIVGGGTAALGAWAFTVTLTDWDFKLSLYYLFAIVFGAYFARSGWRKARPSRIPTPKKVEVENETP
ncbi:hypothetical protein [Pseudomonas eucalypticola]|uniref:Uncharacterized protein n=1 Tax=Pseudomonas eucalypticola TaxID=2599595 RepID=A0A7D5H7P6_9PSED|nr:hypothetical protein [Pseudomonas eucalypticola]QKZ07842.1 hypothetical protein HWQ56_28865 [Pseudomonas eucalypticola]